MYILGISAFYHDSAAVIIHNGEILAAAQEERFSRIKHDASFPKKAVEFCLVQANVSIIELAAVVFYEKPLVKFERLLETYLDNVPHGFQSFRRSIPVWIKEKLFIKQTIRTELGSIGECEKKRLPMLYFDEHHRSHAASAYFPSPFKDSIVLCMDGVGEWATTSIWYGKGNQLQNIKEIQFPHSLGLLYSAFTHYCGFKVNSGEYKLMGLAPYGEPKFVDTILDKLVELNPDGSFKLDMNYFNYHCGLTMTSKVFHNLFDGQPRKPESEITQKQMDLACSIQRVTEQVVLKIVDFARSVVESDNLCLAGGVALNCVANGRLKRESSFANIWIQPAAGDAGGALGAALSLWHGYFEKPKQRKKADSMSGCFLGPGFNNEQIISELKLVGASYQILNEDQIYRTAAQLLADQNVIGWFQDRMEFGPRALGARSILADPRNSEMRSIVNLKIKYRESFRPFAPAVLQEDMADYFEHQGETAYMLFTGQVNKEKCNENSDEFKVYKGFEKMKSIRSKIPAVTHVDYSARIQTVNRRTNSKFYKLLSEFKRLTDCSVLLNTSFNIRGQPIVCTPMDAYECFMKTELDYLIINNCLLSKNDQALKISDIQF